MKPKLHPPETVTKAIALYTSGKSVRKVADELSTDRNHVSNSTVARWVKDAGIMRPQSRASDDDVAKAAELRAEGLSAAKIARRLGRKVPTVQAWLLKLQRADRDAGHRADGYKPQGRKDDEADERMRAQRGAIGRLKPRRHPGGVYCMPFFGGGWR